MATEFVCSCNKTGEDYSTVSAWEAATQLDLTSAATKVFSHGGITGTIGDGDAVTGATSGATANVAHVTSTQILLYNISGTFSSGEDIEKDGATSNKVSISNSGDSAICVLECFKEKGDLTDKFSISGATTNATNYRIA